MPKQSTFKAPVKPINSNKTFKNKSERSISTSEYEEIFQAAIMGSSTNEDSPAPKPKQSEQKVADNIQNSSELFSTDQIPETLFEPTDSELNMSRESHRDGKQDKWRKDNLNISIASSGAGSERKGLFAYKKPTTFKESLKLLEESQCTPEFEQVATCILSQIPKRMPHRDRLDWLQKRRCNTMFIECVKCKKWRHSDFTDPVDVPDKWVCSMNTDKTLNNCNIPAVPIPIHVEEDVIHNIYTAGSLVWAKMDGFPWWPAMVDDCPDNLMYYWLQLRSDIPTYYHVVFFDSHDVTRAWIAPTCLLSYKHHPNYDLKHPYKSEVYRRRISFGKQQANKALNLDIKERLRSYSFLARWKNVIKTPVPSSDDESDIEAEEKSCKSTRTFKSVYTSLSSSDDEEHAENKRNESSSESDNNQDSARNHSVLLRSSQKSIGFDKNIQVNRMSPLAIEQRMLEESESENTENSAKSYVVTYKEQNMPATKDNKTDDEINSTDSAQSSRYCSSSSQSSFQKLLRKDIKKKRLTKRAMKKSPAKSDRNSKSRSPSVKSVKHLKKSSDKDSSKTKPSSAAGNSGTTHNNNKQKKQMITRSPKENSNAENAKVKKQINGRFSLKRSKPISSDEENTVHASIKHKPASDQQKLLPKSSEKEQKRNKPCPKRFKPPLSGDQKSDNQLNTEKSAPSKQKVSNKNQEIFEKVNNLPKTSEQKLPVNQHSSLSEASLKEDNIYETQSKRFKSPISSDERSYTKSASTKQKLRKDQYDSMSEISEKEANNSKFLSKRFKPPISGDEKFDNITIVGKSVTPERKLYVGQHNTLSETLLKENKLHKSHSKKFKPPVSGDEKSDNSSNLAKSTSSKQKLHNNQRDSLSEVSGNDENRTKSRPKKFKPPVSNDKVISDKKVPKRKLEDKDKENKKQKKSPGELGDKNKILKNIIKPSKVHESTEKEKSIGKKLEKPDTYSDSDPEFENSPPFEED